MPKWVSMNVHLSDSTMNRAAKPVYSLPAGMYVRHQPMFIVRSKGFHTATNKAFPNIREEIRGSRKPFSRLLSVGWPQNSELFNEVFCHVSKVMRTVWVYGELTMGCTTQKAAKIPLCYHFVSEIRLPMSLVANILQLRIRAINVCI